jgi:hypothetical protein
VNRSPRAAVPSLPTANKLSSPSREHQDPLRGKPLTFQQYDPADPDAGYPIWDIRKIVATTRAS